MTRPPQRRTIAVVRSNEYCCPGDRSSLAQAELWIRLYSRYIAPHAVRGLRSIARTSSGPSWNARSAAAWSWWIPRRTGPRLARSSLPRKGPLGRVQPRRKPKRLRPRQRASRLSRACRGRPQGRPFKPRQANPRQVNRSRANPSRAAAAGSVVRRHRPRRPVVSDDRPPPHRRLLRRPVRPLLPQPVRARRPRSRRRRPLRPSRRRRALRPLRALPRRLSRRAKRPRRHPVWRRAVGRRWPIRSGCGVPCWPFRPSWGSASCWASGR